MRAGVKAWMVAVVLAAGAVCAPAAVVKEVRIVNRGPGPLDESLVRAQIAVKAGEPLEAAGVSRDVKALLATELFSDVAVEADAREDGVVLTYAVRNKLRLATPVEVVGAEDLGERKVRDLMGLRAGDRVDSNTVAVAALKVEEEYRKRHFVHARVDWDLAVADAAAGIGEVRVRVHEGGRARVRRIEITGEKAVSERVIRTALDVPRWWNVFSWFKSRRFDPDEYQIGCDNVRQVYQDRGYLDVRVGQPQLAEKDRRLEVTIPIEEGMRYVAGEVSISGVMAFRDEGRKEEMRKAVTIRRGDVASAAAIDASAQAVRDYYGSRGYIHTLVEPAVLPQAAPGVVDIEFRVKEGKLTRIGNVEIRGNTRTKDKVIRREVMVFPGEIYDEVKVRRSENRLRNLNYFSEVRSYAEETGTEGESDLVLEVDESEKRTGQFQMGAGFSSVDQVMGYVELSQGNFDVFGWPHFLGGGQKIRARAQLGSKMQDYTGSFVEPWFMDRMLKLGLEGYIRRRNYSEYDVSRKGGAVTLGWPVGRQERMEVTYRLEATDIVNVSDTNAYRTAEGQPFYFTEDEHRIESSLQLTLEHNSRDRFFLATRGTYASLIGRLSGGPLGFDTDIYALEGRVVRHVPLWLKSVLTLETAAEVVDAYGDTDDVPLADRLYAGGPNTIRGYRYRDVGPKVTRTVATAGGGEIVLHKPSGGQSMALGTVEWAVPVVSMIRLAGFFDIGNVWENPYEFDFSTMASSAGVGIRFDIPGFPIRLDYAWPIERDSHLTSRQSFSFAIGPEF